MSKSSTEELSSETWGPYKLKPNPVALLRLALGSAFAIATALLIPDITQLLLASPEQTLFVLKRSLSLWSYAYMLWAIGFLCILHFIRILSRGLILDSDGIRIGRLTKKINWNEIVAVHVQERKLFGKLFFTPAFQMILHLQNQKGKKSSKQIASFFYSRQEFYSLFYHISRWSCKETPASLFAFVSKDITNTELKKLADEGKLKRLALTVLICFGLLSFLGRKAVVNYDYNMGNRAFNSGNYAKACRHYSAAGAVDFSFAPAWDGLARSQLRLGDIEGAEENWKEALKWRPDYVESKLGLSRIYMLQGRYEEAEKMVSSARRLAPLDEAAFLNRAQLDLLMGKSRLAVESLETFVKQSSGRARGACILARAYLKRAELEKAKGILQMAGSEPQNFRFVSGFLAMVKAEISLQEKDYASAERHLKEAGKLVFKDADYFLDMAEIKIGKGDFAEAEKDLAKAEKFNQQNPWLSLCRAKLYLQDLPGQNKQSRTSKFESCLSQALANKYKDACIYAAAAELYLAAAQKEKARELAERAIQIDPSIKRASKLLDRLSGTDLPAAANALLDREGKK